MQWFHDQRAYPFTEIPAGLRRQAIRDTNALTGAPVTAAVTATPWIAIGPQPSDTPYSYSVVAGRVTALVVDPGDINTVYAGTAEGGVWKTSDGGAHWMPLTDTAVSLAVGSLALYKPTPSSTSVRLYVGTGEENFSGDSYYGEGILQLDSTDGGLTWTTTTIPGPFAGPVGDTSLTYPDGGGAHIGALAIQPGSNGLTLLAAVQLSGKDGIYRGTYNSNTGWTWTNVRSGAPGTAVMFDPTNGNIAYAALGLYSGSSYNGVYKSTNGGTTWAKLGGGLPTTYVGRVALAMAPSSPTTLYAGISETATYKYTLRGFYKTTNGGTNWAKLSPPDYCLETGTTGQCFYDNVITVQPGNARLVLAGGAFQNTLIRSLDGGTSWATLSGNSIGSYALHPDLHALAFSPDGSTLYLGTDGGVYSTTGISGGTPTFLELNDTLAVTQFYSGISIDPANLGNTIGGTQDNGVQQYTAPSLIWQQFDVVGGCGDGGMTAMDPVNPNNLYAACPEDLVWKSTDGGGSWKQVLTNITDRSQFVAPLAMDPSNSQALYYGTYRVYQTTTGGNSWSAISPTTMLSSPATLTALAVAPSDAKTVYAGASNGQVHVTSSANLGTKATWVARSTGLPSRFVTHIAVDLVSSATAYATFSGFKFGKDTHGHIYKTTNSGTSWSDISGNLPNTPVNDIVIDPDVANTLYVATDTGVLSTADGGKTWTPLGSGLPNVAVLGLEFHHASRTLRAASHGRSAWDFALPAPPLTVAATVPAD